MRYWNWIVAALVAVAATGAQAQAVYRCGSSYGSQPCEGGSAVAAPLAAPSSADGKKAVHAAKVDAKRADALEKARLAQEKNAPKAVVMGPKQPASALKAKPTPPLKKVETFSAKGPAPAKKP